MLAVELAVDVANLLGVPVDRLAPLALHEAHGRTVAERGGQDADRLGVPGLDVVVQALPVDPLLERALERGLEQSSGAHARHAEELAGQPHHPQRRARPDYPAQHRRAADAGPALEQRIDLPADRQVGERGQRGGVYRPDAGAAEDRDALPAGGELGQEDRKRPGLVGAPHAAARQDDGDGRSGPVLAQGAQPRPAPGSVPGTAASRPAGRPAAAVAPRSHRAAARAQPAHAPRAGSRPAARRPPAGLRGRCRCRSRPARRG